MCVNDGLWLATDCLSVSCIPSFDMCWETDNRVDQPVQQTQQSECCSNAIQTCKCLLQWNRMFNSGRGLRSAWRNWAYRKRLKDSQCQSQESNPVHPRIRGRSANNYAAMLGGHYIQSLLHEIYFWLCLVILSQHCWMSYSWQKPILNRFHCATVQLEMLCFWSPSSVFRLWTETPHSTNASIFSPQHGLFYTPAITQYYKASKCHIKACHSLVPLSFVSTFPLLISCSGPEQKLNSVWAWYTKILFGWVTTTSASLPWWCWTSPLWVLCCLNP